MRDAEGWAAAKQRGFTVFYTIFFKYFLLTDKQGTMSGKINGAEQGEKT
jgi:hypothetical protein